VRRVGLLAAAIALVAVGYVLARWLPGPRAPVPSAGVNVPTMAAPADRFGLPDPKRTPGSINPAVTQANIDETICTAGWANSVRPPSAYTSALKLAQIIEYGYADRDPRHYQEDHLVPLELGGAPRDPRNLWPEPNTITLPDGTTIKSGAKDDLEDYLHVEVCAGATRLDDAQRSIAGDWIDAWTNAGRP
jgi:hypothetical protein